MNCIMIMRCAGILLLAPTLHSQQLQTVAICRETVPMRQAKSYEDLAAQFSKEVELQATKQQRRKELRCQAQERREQFTKAFCEICAAEADDVAPLTKSMIDSLRKISAEFRRKVTYGTPSMRKGIYFRVRKADSVEVLNAIQQSITDSELELNLSLKQNIIIHAFDIFREFEKVYLDKCLPAFTLDELCIVLEFRLVCFATKLRSKDKDLGVLSDDTYTAIARNFCDELGKLDAEPTRDVERQLLLDGFTRMHFALVAQEYYDESAAALIEKLEERLDELLATFFD